MFHYTNAQQSFRSIRPVVKKVLNSPCSATNTHTRGSREYRLFTIREHQLSVLLIQRATVPHMDKWALPGKFVDLTEDLIFTSMVKPSFNSRADSSSLLKPGLLVGCNLFKQAPEQLTTECKTASKCR